MTNTLTRYRNANGTYRYVWSNGSVQLKASKRKFDQYQTYQVPARFVGGPGEMITMGRTKASHLREFWTGSVAIGGDE